MDRKILQEYMDACELVKETEQDIERLQKKEKTILTGNVKGSMADFPYTETHFKIAGTAFDVEDDIQLRMEEKMLRERKEQAAVIRKQVEEWMNTIPVRMQRIIRYKFFEKLSWEETARRIGRRATGDGIRMELNNFMKNKK